MALLPCSQISGPMGNPGPSVLDPVPDPIVQGQAEPVPGPRISSGVERGGIAPLEPRGSGWHHFPWDPISACGGMGGAGLHTAPLATEAKY